MNIPADVRLRQLEINIVRLKAYTGNLGERFVMANIPAAAVETVRERCRRHPPHRRRRAKIDRQSPVMMTKATDINFNPYWTVPGLDHPQGSHPAMQANPNYLSEHKIRIFDKAATSCRPDQIDWNSR